MSNSEINIVPMTPRFGATVLGLDAKEVVPDEVIQQMAAALLEYKVLFLPQQHLDREQQHAFANRFGPPFEFKTQLHTDIEEEGLTELTVVSHFHSDNMFMEEQPAHAMLQMLQLPDVGGDTMWLDLAASYEGLSKPVQDFIEPLTAIQMHPEYYLSDADLAKRYREKYGKELSPDELAARRNVLRPKESPLVRIIPETGKRFYWCSPQHTSAIKELSRDESDAVLKMLFKQQMRPEFLARWRWSVGDIAFWDHRTTLHAGVNDYGQQVRRGRRANIGVTRPVPATSAAALA